jgi:hypothetical protein
MPQFAVYLLPGYFTFLLIENGFRGKYMKMPKELTEENGAKKILLGEFSETIREECPECSGDGYYLPGAGSLIHCDLCDGRGSHIVTIPVQWTTIKDLYARIVKAVEDGEITV